MFFWTTQYYKYVPSTRILSRRVETSVELIASHWTIAGTLPDSQREYSPYDFRDRVQAAAEAGFKGIGIWHADLDHILELRTLSEMKRILDDNGMKYVELEFLTDWFLEGERKRRSDARKKMLLDAAEVLRAKHVKVGDFTKEKCDFDHLVDSFATLCGEAANHGTSIAFEPMGAAVLDTLHDSLRMVSAAGAKNGGIILDIWQVVDRAMPNEEVRRIPSRYLMGVELNDAAMDGARARQDKANPRTFCGAGDFDIAGFISRVRESGYRGPWGVEVIGEALLAMPLREVAERAFSTTIHQFGGSGET
jgi:sugar phosphate isomerase/epimerase